MARIHRSLFTIAACAAGFFLPYAPAIQAQNSPTGETPRVAAVRVVAESGAVLLENPPDIAVQPGQPFSIETERASLRTLYNTGRYEDLRAELADVSGGVRLDFIVRESIFINRVQIIGLQEPPSEATALASLRLNLGEPFREPEMKEAIERLRESLVNEGLYGAHLDYKLVPHPETHQMDIQVIVIPGERAKLGTVALDNDTQFPEEELRRRLNLKSGDSLTSDRLNSASERMRTWLVQRGYLGARIAVRRSDWDPQQNRVPLNVTVYAGSPVEVRVEGAQISTKNLRQLLPIYQEGAVDDDLLQEGRRALRDWFERQGYFDVQVSYDTSQPPAQETLPATARSVEVVTFRVELGPRHRLAGVSFSGNRYFSNEILRSRLRIEPAAYANAGRYSSALLQDDLASIRSLYDSNGFHGVAVTSALIQDHQGSKGNLFVEFEIDEGTQTRVADLVIEGNKELSTDELLGVVGSVAGQPYSDFNISTDRDNILALYYDQGFPEAQFSAAVENLPGPGPEGGPRVRLAYQIAEGPQLVVSRILMGGYENTRPGVIYRQVDLQAGDALSEGAVVETQRKLYNLGIFSRVSIAPQNPEGSDPNKAMVVLVDEARRYTIAYGAGLEAQRLGGAGVDPIGGSFSVSPRGIFEVSKANFTGRADTLSLKVRASTIQGRGLLAYTASNYFGRPEFSLQVSAFLDKTRDVQTFTSRRYEGSVQLAQRVSLITSLLYRYSYRRVTATDLSGTINPAEIPLFNQPTQVSSFGVSWFRDRRDSPVSATRGEFENVDISFASTAFGSSASFLRVFLQNSTYHPVGRRLSFARSTRFGFQTPFGKTIATDIPLPERFFAGGGTTLRGFGLNQAGPRDPVTGFPVGGQALLIFNQELRFPLHLPLVGNRLGGAVFYDAGNVFASVRDISIRTSPRPPVFDQSSSPACISNCNQLSYFSHTIGFEFRYNTPIGPVALDLAYQLNPARFLIPVSGCNPATTTCALTTARLPHFQFFINLGTTF